MDSERKVNPDTISFSSPAKTWEEALPVGNGRLGGMVFGLPFTERIQLNEDSVWYGGPQDRNNPSAKENLPKIRSLIMEGRISEAQELCTFALSGIPEEQRHYEPLGNLYIEFDGTQTEYSDYHRELDLTTATVTTRFTLSGTAAGTAAFAEEAGSGVTYTREVIASYPKNAMIIHLTSDRPGMLNFHAQLGRGAGKPWEEISYQKQTIRRQCYNGFCDSITGRSGGVHLMEATAGGKGGVSIACGIKVIARGGKTELIGNTTRVLGADEAMIILCADTTFREKDPAASVLARLEETGASGWEELYREHVEDYRALFDRVKLTIDGQEDQYQYGNELLAGAGDGTCRVSGAPDLASSEDP